MGYMDEHESTPAVTRRQALKAGVGTVAGAVTLGTAGSGSAVAQSSAYGGYLSEAEWDGTTADASGTDEVIVDVGAGMNGYQFNPPAIYVEPGQTITWRWTGKGGAHNVVAEEGGLDSREAHDGSLVGEEGFTYEVEFDESMAGVHQYFCVPHKTLGMLGVVVVGEDNVETDLTSYSRGGGSGMNFGSVVAGAGVFGAVSLIGVGAYNELVGNE
ncbi:halocyanin domain-containing protein [Halovenus aranensis]|nr:halocyanin domain-containing protein [Halovenus aranensis]